MIPRCHWGGCCQALQTLAVLLPLPPPPPLLLLLLLAMVAPVCLNLLLYMPPRLQHELVSQAHDLSDLIQTLDYVYRQLHERSEPDLLLLLLPSRPHSSHPALAELLLQVLAELVQQQLLLSLQQQHRRQQQRVTA